VYGIFEIGTNHRGEIAPLASLVRPHIGIITAIAEAHIEHMQSRQAIAEEKSDIFSATPPCHFAIINQDSPEFGLIESRAKAFGIPQIIGFGKSTETVVQLAHYHPDPTGLKGIATARLANQDIPYTLPHPGEHVAMNSLIALAVGKVLELDQEQLVRQLETLPSVQGRGQQHRIPISGGEILLIDDAYNANLASMRAGLSIVAGIPVPSNGRRLVVLGEMLELGNQADAHHQQLMEIVSSCHIDLVFAVGGAAMKEAFHSHIPPEKAGGYASHVEALEPFVMDSLRPNDIVFVKGSKRSQVSKIVDLLVAKKNSEDGMVR